MGRMTWHQATPQRLEPFGPDRHRRSTADSLCCRGRAGVRVIAIPRRPRLTTPALPVDRTNLALRLLGWLGLRRHLQRF